MFLFACLAFSVTPDNESSKASSTLSKKKKSKHKNMDGKHFVTERYSLSTASRRHSSPLVKKT